MWWFHPGNFFFSLISCLSKLTRWTEMPPANSHVSISLLKVYEGNPIASRRAIWFSPRFGSEIFVREALNCRYSRCVILDLGDFIGSIRHVRSTFLQFFLQLSSPNFRLPPGHGHALIPNRYPHELQTMPSTTPKIATIACRPPAVYNNHVTTGDSLLRISTLTTSTTSRRSCMIIYIDYLSTSCPVVVFLLTYNNICSLCVSHLVLILSINGKP